MKNSKLVSIVLVLMVFAIMMVLPKAVFAENVIDIRDQITKTDSTTSTSTTGTSSTGTTSTTNTTITDITTPSTTKTTDTLTSTTSSSSNLPKTGADSVVPGIILIVILVASAIFAFKKIQYYKNI